MVNSVLIRLQIVRIRDIPMAHLYGTGGEVTLSSGTSNLLVYNSSRTSNKLGVEFIIGEEPQFVEQACKWLKNGSTELINQMKRLRM